MAIGSGRWFGFVAGGALPASLASDWLVSAWDQNTGLAEPTPSTSALEVVAGRWLLELLGLPAHSSFAFVTGCQMAHVTCLAAARHAVYARRRLGSAATGTRGRAAVARRRRRRTARDDHARAPPARDRRRAGDRRCGATAKDGCRPRVSPPRSTGATRRSSARRRARSTRARSTTSQAIADASTGIGRLGARRRRVRALGRGKPGARPSRRGSRRAPTRGRPTRTSG